MDDEKDFWYEAGFGTTSQQRYAAAQEQSRQEESTGYDPWCDYDENLAADNVDEED